MHEYPLLPHGVPVKLHVKLGDVVQEIRVRVVPSSHPRHVPRRRHQLLGHIQPYDGHPRPAAVELVRSLRVAERVGLGARVHVAIDEEGPGQVYDLVELVLDVLVLSERQGDVRGGRHGHDRHLAGELVRLLDDEVGCGLALDRPERGLWLVRVAKAIVAVDKVSDALLLRPDDARQGPFHDGDVGTAELLHQVQRVLRRHLGSNVPEQRRDPDDLNLRASQRQAYGPRVVNPGIRVDYQFPHPRLTLCGVKHPGGRCESARRVPAIWQDDG